MPPSPDVLVSTFRLHLVNRGLRGALQYLNSESSHRFTAVFRFAGDTLQNLHLIDRLDPSVERCPDLPVLQSYCVFVRDLKQTFQVDDAAVDDRVTGHPKREAVQSYCGIPLLDETGQLFGTICHFDYEAIPISREEVWVLEDVAPAVVRAINEEQRLSKDRPVLGSSALQRASTVAAE